MSDVSQGPKLDILSDEFAEQAAAAGDRARRSALAQGIPVTYLDEKTRTYIRELPDGRKFEIRWIPGAPRNQNFEIVRELIEHL